MSGEVKIKVVVMSRNEVGLVKVGRSAVVGGWGSPRNEGGGHSKGETRKSKGVGPQNLSNFLKTKVFFTRDLAPIQSDLNVSFGLQRLECA